MLSLTPKQLANQKYYRSQKGLLSKIYGQQKQSAKKRNMDMPTYTKDEFITAVIEMELFKDLYKKWVISEYCIDLTPSIDRIDDYISYTENNIQLMTWKENNLKSHKDRKMGINNKQHRAVKQFTLLGVYITTFPSIAIAARTLNIQQSNILKCCKKTRNKTGGFKWAYKEQK